MRQLYRDTFEEEGYRVVEAEGAGAALSLLREHAIDLAIVDIRMPGTHGLELLSSLRATYPWLPVILCSAFGRLFDEYAVWEAREQVVGLFNKPVDVNALLGCLDRVLGIPSRSP